MYFGLHVRYPIFLSDFNGNGIFWQVFEKYSNVKFHENMFSGSQVVPCGQTEGQKDKHDETNGRYSQFCESD
jgi:hypothetical protein